VRQADKVAADWTDYYPEAIVWRVADDGTPHPYATACYGGWPRPSIATRLGELVDIEPPAGWQDRAIDRAGLRE